jgi:hypothetical protein
MYWHRWLPAIHFEQLGLISSHCVRFSKECWRIHVHAHIRYTFFLCCLHLIQPVLDFSCALRNLMSVEEVLGGCRTMIKLSNCYLALLFMLYCNRSPNCHQFYRRPSHYIRLRAHLDNWVPIQILISDGRLFVRGTQPFTKRRFSSDSATSIWNARLTDLAWHITPRHESQCEGTLIMCEAKRMILLL